MTTDLASLRDVAVERTKRKGYKLKGLDKEYHLRPKEALSLLESLLRQLPEVTDGVRASWELRDKPHVKVRTFYGVRDGKVDVMWYMGEVWLKGRRLYWTSASHVEVDSAVRECQEFYGRGDLELREVYDCPGSKTKAENDLMMKKVEGLRKELGLSLPGFLAKLKAGGITNEMIEGVELQEAEPREEDSHG